MLIIFISLISNGQAEARTLDVVQVYTSEANNPTELFEILGNPNTDTEEISTFQLQDYDVEEEDDKLERLDYPHSDSLKSGILVDNSATSKVDANGSLSGQNEGTNRNVRNVRNARQASNVCIKKYIYRIIYNYLFRIPICKASCKPKVRNVTFKNGKTRAIRYDCY